jgi:phosphatidylglycerol:prolipoprotein diacylglycerol transferase
VRFVLDFFRETEGDSPLSGDPRYGGLTPAQWACFGLLALGLWFLRKAYRDDASADAASPDAASPDAAEDTGSPDSAEDSGSAPRPRRKNKNKKKKSTPSPTADEAPASER